jgi:hypothetical protein
MSAAIIDGVVDRAGTASLLKSLHAQHQHEVALGMRKDTEVKRLFSRTEVEQHLDHRGETLSAAVDVVANGSRGVRRGFDPSRNNLPHYP